MITNQMATVVAVLAVVVGWFARVGWESVSGGLAQMLENGWEIARDIGGAALLVAAIVAGVWILT